ncbi:unnamed protein product [Arctogadus glacialis]
MVARSRSVLQEQTVGDGGARREVRGGPLEVLAVRSVAVVWRIKDLEVLEADCGDHPGGPGGGGSSSSKAQLFSSAS